MAFYCNGKKGICDVDFLCADCAYYDDSGGMQVQTHADRIRAMTDEELANMRVHYNPETDMYTNDTGEAYYDFVSAMEAELEWLQQPAEGDA